MRPTTLALALLGAALAAAPAVGSAQSASPGTQHSATTDTHGLVAGSNSFTEGQARSRIEKAGYSKVSGLHKDDQGIWRGKAMHNGSSTDVALDYRGHVVAGAAARGPASGIRPRATPATPDGTPGDPPSTTTGRAADRMQGQTPRADGTPGNPPGTAASRATDRALGTNGTGTNPQGSGAASGGGAPAR